MSEIEAIDAELTGELVFTPTIHQALSAVMGDVQSVSKSSHNDQQNFNFRGIDAVVNAVGPALRRHGVVVVPTKAVAEIEHYQTSKGTAMKNVALTVKFRFYGPAGDFVEATARGEAADSGDKATSKAHSVAFRTVLLEALCIPTDDPDPDSQLHERGVPRREPKKRASAQKTELPGETFEDIFTHPEGVELAPANYKKKLDVLVGQLRKADKLKTERIYTYIANLRTGGLADKMDGVDQGILPPRDPDGTLHWGPLRDTLSKDEAHKLIDQLTELQAAE
jgi:hypothetical protein